MSNYMLLILTRTRAVVVILIFDKVDFKKFN